MAESLRGGLSLGLCGFAFWSHDIGGFEGLPPAHVYKRWLAFGLLSSHSRLHGSTSYRVPWNYDDEACAVLRRFTQLKCTLMPYLYAAAAEAAATGVPVLRAMLLEFPEDPACATLDRQYMLGGSLLVAPVFSEDGSASFYLPHGRWTHLLTGEAVEGGSWRREVHDCFGLPLYVRDATVLALGANQERPDYDYARDLTLQIFLNCDGASASCAVHGQDGVKVATVIARRTDGVTVVEWDAELPGLRIQQGCAGPITNVRKGQRSVQWAG
jgi:alpha-D-xyloside xylohydrolase